MKPIMHQKEKLVREVCSSAGRQYKHMDCMLIGWDLGRRWLKLIPPIRFSWVDARAAPAASCARPRRPAPASLTTSSCRCSASSPRPRQVHPLQVYLPLLVRPAWAAPVPGRARAHTPCCQSKLKDHRAAGSSTSPRDLDAQGFRNVLRPCPPRPARHHGGPELHWPECVCYLICNATHSVRWVVVPGSG